MKSKITDIKPHPINDQIYSTTDLSDLKNSIEINGQLEPIVVNKDNTIISGNKKIFFNDPIRFLQNVKSEL